MKKLLTFFLTALLAFSVGWAVTTSITFSDRYSANTPLHNVTIQVDDNVSITFSRAEGSTSPQYYASGTSVRMYAKNTLTVNCTQTISDIVLTFGSGDGSNPITSDVGNYSNGTWSGSSSNVVFTEGGTSGNRRIAAITITYGSGTTVVRPTISPNGGNFLTSQEVTLSHADGGTIYYTLDGNDPTESSTQYTAPFTINATTTVKAIAVKDGVSSAVASATFTKVGVGTIAEAYAVPQESTFTFTGFAVVTYQNGRNVWIRDNSGSGLIYRNSGETSAFNNGDILNANWSATNTTYNQVIPEFNNPSGVTSSSNGGTVAPFDRTSTGITTANVNEYVSFSNVTLSWDTSVGYCYYAVGNNRIYFRNNYFNNGLSVSSGNTYNIEGIAYIEKKNNTNIPVVYLTKVTAVSPVLTVTPSALTINDSGTNNTFTVEGSNLGGDNVGVTQTNSKFAPTLSIPAETGIGWATNGGTYWFFSPDNGSLNGTVSMDYTDRELSASETVSLGNSSGASATVTVNYRADVYILGNYGSGWDYTNGILMTYDATNNTYTGNVTVDAGNLIVFARKLGLNEDNSWNTRYLFGPNSGGDWWVNGDNATGTIDLYDDDPIYFVNGGTYIVTIDANTGALTVAKEVIPEGTLYEKVTSTADLVDGDYLIVYETDGKAFDGSLDNMDPIGNVFDVTINNNKIVTERPAYFTIDVTNGTILSASGYYIGRTTNSNGFNQNATVAYTHAISFDDNGNAIITSSGGPKLQMWSQMSNGVMQYRFRYYTSSQKAIQLYRKHSDIAEPRITVNPTSLDLVIPVGSSSVDGTVTVTETNTTGTTSVAVSGTGANYFSATLENGTLTVTYSGTATQANPDQATITLTNGSATATVTVTGYKRVQATGTLYTKVTKAEQIQDGFQYIIVFENTTTNNLNLGGPQALNGVNGGGTGTTVEWEEQGSIINISGTDAIEFTLNGNASSATLSYASGSTTYYLEAGSAPSLDLKEGDPTEGYDWSIANNDNGYYLQWTNDNNQVYTLRYNTGMSAADRFRLYTSGTGQIAYLYVQGSAVATPVITPASGNYTEDQEVTISCATTGATIYYTVNGGETQTYNGPFMVDVDEDHTTTTIAAWAEDGEQHHSPTVTVTYTYNKDHVNSIAEFLALENGEEVTFSNPVIVLFDYSQNSSGGQEYIWVKDRTGYTQLFITPQFDASSVADPQYSNYGNFVPKYENGDVIPAGFKVKKNYYETGEYFQAMCTDTHNTFQIADEKALADPEQVTLSELLANPAIYNNRYLYINKLQVSNVEGLNFRIATDEDGNGSAEVQGGTTIVGYNKYNSPAWKNKQGDVVGVTLPTDNNYYNVKFIFQKWSNGYEIMPIEFTEWQDNSVRLEDLVETGVVDNDYTISNDLIAAVVTWDDNKKQFAIFAKDDEMYANKRYPTDGMDSYLIEYANQDSTFINDVPQDLYDQSNWIEILIPSTINDKGNNDYSSELSEFKTMFEGKILAGGSISGKYKDALNPTIQMSQVPSTPTMASAYAPNYYCTGNFLMENLDADGAQSYRDDELAGGSYFMMDAKPQEYCKVIWAYFEDNSNYFVAPEREGDLINGLRLHGSFLADMSLCEDQSVTAERTAQDVFAASGSGSGNTSVLYGFRAIVRKNSNSTVWGGGSNGAPSRIAPFSDGMETPQPAYIVYPLEGQNSSENVTDVEELLNVNTKTVVSVRYYNMMGMESRTPFDGINVVVTRYSDGSTSTLKVIK